MDIGFPEVNVMLCVFCIVWHLSTDWAITWDIKTFHKSFCFFQQLLMSIQHLFASVTSIKNEEMIGSRAV